MMMIDNPTSLSFDPQDPAYLAEPHPYLKRFREAAPIFYWEQAKGYVLFRHRDVRELLRDSRLITDQTLGAGFSPEMRQNYPSFVAIREADLFMVQPEAHTRLRRLANPAFAPGWIEKHLPHISSKIEQTLDTLPTTGQINVASFARQYPVRVICMLLGLEPGSEPAILEYADAVAATFAPLGPEQFAAYMPAIERGHTLIRAEIAARRAHPRDDLLGRMVHASHEQDRLDEHELVALVSALLIGGSDTTAHLTTMAVWELLRHPEQLDMARADSGLFRAAVDETLRFRSVFRIGLLRYAAVDFSYEGVDFRRGDQIFLSPIAATCDPDHQENPDVFDICRRQSANPLWFGYGPHFCIGAALARLEIEVALKMFFGRYPKATLAGRPVFGTHPAWWDVVDLPVRVEALASPSGDARAL